MPRANRDPWVLSGLQRFCFNVASPGWRRNGPDPDAQGANLGPTHAPFKTVVQFLTENVPDMCRHLPSMMDDR